MKVLLSLIAFLFILFVIKIIAERFFSLIIRTVAAPALMGFIVLERYHKVSWLTINKQPKRSDDRGLWLNIFASVISVFVIYHGNLFVSALIKSWENSERIVFSFDLKITTVIICLILPTIFLFLINAFFEKDQDDNYTKLSKYDITGLLRLLGSKFG